MSRNSKKKKSTSKYRDFKVSPLIAVTALIEVVVLVVVSSFAWFYLSENKEVNIGTGLKVPAGLRFYFKYILPCIIGFVVMYGLVTYF